MSVITDFFVASPAELQAAFPSYLPVADKPEMRERVNPFTMEKVCDYLIDGYFQGHPDGRLHQGHPDGRLHGRRYPSPDREHLGRSPW